MGDINFLVSCGAFIAGAFSTGFVVGRWSKQWEKSQIQKTITQRCDLLESYERNKGNVQRGAIFGNSSPLISVRIKGDKAYDCDCAKLNRNSKQCTLTGKPCAMLH